MTFKRSLMTASAAVVMLTAVQAHAGSYDFVSLVDESGSMTGTQAFTGAYVSGLDTELQSLGQSGRYGLVGFGSASQSVRTLTVGGGLFGTAAEFNTATQSLVINGAVEDGYLAISHALNNHGSSFAASHSKNLLLFTDETRAVVDSSLSKSSITERLKSEGVRLNTMVDVDIYATTGEKMIVAFKDNTGRLVGLVNDGGTLRVLPVKTIKGTDSKTAYAEIALETGGVVGDIEYLSGSDAAAGVFGKALTRALLQVDQNFTATVQAAHRDSVKTTSTATVRTQVRAVLNVVRDRLSAMRTPGQGFFALANAQGQGMTGMAAGDGDNLIDGFSVWIAPTYARMSNSSSSAGYEGRGTTVMGGFDTVVGNRLVAGAVLVGEGSRINLDTGAARETDGKGVVAYGAYAFDETFGANLQLGYTMLQNNLYNGGGLGGYAEFDSRRYSGSAAVTGTWAVSDYFIDGSVGYTYAVENFDDYEDNLGVTVSPDKVRLGQSHAGVEVARSFGQIAPYIMGRVEYDHVGAPNGDSFGMVAGGGVRLASEAGAVVGNLSADRTVARDSTSDYSVTASLRVNF